MTPAVERAIHDLPIGEVTEGWVIGMIMRDAADLDARTILAKCAEFPEVVETLDTYAKNPLTLRLYWHELLTIDEGRKRFLDEWRALRSAY